MGSTVAEPTSKPGDFVGQDSTGRVRIDRVIPLRWMLTVVGAVLAHAAASWFQLQALDKTVQDMRTTLTQFTSWQVLAQVESAKHEAAVVELRRRVESLEVRLDRR